MTHTPPNRKGTGSVSWTKRNTMAAQLLAEDRLTDDEIAEQVGVSRRQLARWKEWPEFAARIDSLVEEWREKVRKRGIADKSRRIAALDDRWKRMQQVIAERAADPDMQDVPGGKTGLLVKQYKSVGRGDDSRTVEEYAVDTGLLREMREAEAQVSKELGQWIGVRGGEDDDGRPVPDFVVQIVGDDQTPPRTG